MLFSDATSLSASALPNVVETSGGNDITEAISVSVLFFQFLHFFIGEFMDKAYCYEFPCDLIYCAVPVTDVGFCALAV
jgi:hypothetical protein